MQFHFKTDVDQTLKSPDRILFINLLQIYKEAITNAAKHSGATSVHVKVASIKEHLKLSIRNDGMGFGEDIVRGKGLSNMKVRAQKIGGNLSIQSDNGTSVALEWSENRDPQSIENTDNV